MRDIICDVDGTLTDTGHRQHYVNSKPSNWSAFNAGIPHDPPHQHVIDLINVLHDAGWRIVLCSGRNEASRADTVDWMSRHDVKYNALYMRPEGDYRGDEIVKLELLDQATLDGYNITMAIDDRQKVVDAWRARNIPCLQAAPGDF